MTSAIDQVMAKLHTWLHSVAAMLPNLVAALLILIGFWFLARLARRVLVRALRRVSPQTVVSNLLATLGAITVFTVGLLVALGVLRLDKTVTSLLAGAGVMGLALGFAFQSIAANFLSGILISVRHPFTVGDLVETNGYFGHVAEINLRATVLRTLDGRLVFLPNRDVLEKAIVNYTAAGVRRVELKMGISYGEDLERVSAVTLEALRGVSKRVREREPELYFEEFGSSSINFTFRFWIPFREQPDYLAALSEAIMRIKSAYDREGITIPFPIRTIDFGIKGGQAAADVVTGFLPPREE
jgi:small conductance mechanosensitive channel